MSFSIVTNAAIFDDEGKEITSDNGVQLLLPAHWQELKCHIGSGNSIAEVYRG